eukprot:3367687-Rhodomonas_salina.3
MTACSGTRGQEVPEHDDMGHYDAVTSSPRGATLPFPILSSSSPPPSILPSPSLRREHRVTCCEHPQDAEGRLVWGFSSWFVGSGVFSVWLGWAWSR